MEGNLNTQTRSQSGLPVAPLTLNIEHPQFGTVAHIVLETGIWRRAVGGIRMLPDVTQRHVADLARAMTYKFAFLNMPFTGAKGGIVSSPSWFPEHKSEVLQYIGESTGQLIRNGLYAPGPDLGVGLQECWAILRGAGYSTPDRDPDTWRDATDSPGYPTGMTVFVVTDEALASIDMRMKGATIAIEGFGKVGAAAAKLFSDAGAKVVAVSTTSGAIFAPEGLDVDSLLADRAKYGDDCVQKHCIGDAIPVESLLSLPVDILSPCAGQWTIGPHNRDKLDCKLIVAGSNCFIDPDIRTDLENKKDLLVMPDFLSSSGTVLASNLLGSIESRMATINTQFRLKIRSVMRRHQSSGEAPVPIAQSIAESNLRAVMARESTARRREIMYSLALKIAQSRYVPTRVQNSMSRIFEQSWLGQSETDIES